MNETVTMESMEGVLIGMKGWGADDAEVELWVLGYWGLPGFAVWKITVRNL